VLEHWSLGVFHSIQSGNPLSFNMGTDVALNGTNQNQRAQLAEGLNYADIVRSHPDRTSFTSEFFSTEAFVAPSQIPRGFYGTSGRNIISGPASNRTDISVMKDIVIREGFRTQLRGEFFNALNQVSFSDPNTNASSGSFGRITGAGSGREIQLALKLLW
jgi:hypothetical protein